MRYQSKLVPTLLMAAAMIRPASALAQNTTANASMAQRRPANVPSEYMITPFGYFHPSCIQKLAKGERVLATGHIQRANGVVEETAAACNYMHYTATGVPALAAALKRSDNAPSPEVDGWIASASITTNSESNSYGALIATWTVPHHPKVDNGQVLFFFPGFEDIGSGASILQPVLQWSQRQWAIASWNCCLNNIVTESPVVNVSPGDTIYGSITSNCPAGTQSCSTWNVLTLDMSTGQSTTLGGTPSDGQVFNWAFGGVMEPYFVISCDDYPPDRKLIFQNVSVFNGRLRAIAHPKWTEVVDTTQTPQCGYQIKAKEDVVKIGY